MAGPKGLIFSYLFILIFITQHLIIFYYTFHKLQHNHKSLIPSIHHKILIHNTLEIQLQLDTILKFISIIINTLTHANYL
jgi:hypothetical protein